MHRPSCAFLPSRPLLLRPALPPPRTRHAPRPAPLFCTLPQPQQPQQQQQQQQQQTPKQPRPSRMFSNVAPSQHAQNASLQRQRPSQLACTALIAGTMVGAGVLALPTVTAPAGFLPSTAALLAVWLYMLTTGLLISEVTINTACSLGRPNAISILSLAKLTLGNVPASITTLSYTLLHYAILTAYTSQGAAQATDLLHYLLPSLHTPLPASPFLSTSLFAALIATAMYRLPARQINTINNTLVVAVALSFLAVLTSAAPDAHPANLLNSHWHMLTQPHLIPVLFVSCVYHNVVSTVTIRLEGHRRKIRRALLAGSLIPVLMFIAYDAAMLASSSAPLGPDLAPAASHLPVAAFSLLAIVTSFVGFVEGLTDLYADLRQTLRPAAALPDARWADFVATVAPPSLFAALCPDVFLNALDAAGTYGIAFLFGALPAAMAWRNRRHHATKHFERAVAGGDPVLALVAIVPVAIIAQRIWQTLHPTV